MNQILELPKYKLLNSNILKMIAIVCMTIDHLAWAIFGNYNTNTITIIMHILGRITCPIMCYFIAEGFFYTHNYKKYVIRMFIFAFISHFAYIFASNDFVNMTSFIPFYNGSLFNQTSVMWGLAWGLVLLKVFNLNIKTWLKMVIAVLVCIITLPGDWSCIAPLAILCLGLNRDKNKVRIISCFILLLLYILIYFIIIDKVYAMIQFGTFLSIPLIMMYNGKRGNNKKMNNIIKWLFYLYYPIHLIIIGLLLLFNVFPL